MSPHNSLTDIAIAKIVYLTQEIMPTGLSSESLEDKRKYVRLPAASFSNMQCTFYRLRKFLLPSTELANIKNGNLYVYM